MQSYNSKLSADIYSSFPVEKLVDNSTSDFDLFIKVQQHFILYSPPGYKWEKDELNNLVGKGYDKFFISNADKNKAHMYLQMSKLPQVEKFLKPTERIQSIEQIGADFIKCLHEGEITPAVVEKAEGLSTSIVECIQEDLRSIQHLSILSDHDYYTYFHSIRVSSYATAIAYKMGIKETETLKDIALGGIFHDIGKKNVPLEIINKAGPLTNNEWEIMRSHPQKGFKAVEDSILSHVPREIIHHHHEKLDGSGYPDNLDKHSLLPEVQIATLADIFDALTSSRSYQNKRSKFDALSLIKHRFLDEHINTDAFKALVSCLAI